MCTVEDRLFRKFFRKEDSRFEPSCQPLSRPINNAGSKWAQFQKFPTSPKVEDAIKKQQNITNNSIQIATLKQTARRRQASEEKKICLFLPGWLNPVKTSLNIILHKHLSMLLRSQTQRNMFQNYDIYIMFRNAAKIKNLIVKTKV